MTRPTFAPELIVAPAKLTTSLRVTGRRADGYHFIDAVMTTLDLHDLVEITPDESGLEIVGPYAEGISTADDNLVMAALELCGRRAKIRITKNIPHGGGLGGGSANAAAVLRWAQFTTEQNIIDSARIGADIPFCIFGGRARVRGIGEIIEPLDDFGQAVTLIIPPLHVSTPAVYRAWDDLGGPTSSGPNDLEPAALIVAPELTMWRDRIGEVVGRPPVLAGSGATWFVTDLTSAEIADLRQALPAAQVVETRSKSRK